MSDAVFDRGLYFPSPMTDWYRGRPFKVAFVGSLLIHAALIALIPGFRAVVIEPPKVLNVEIVLSEQPQAQPTPSREAMPPPQRTAEEKLVRPEPQIEPRPEPVLRQPEPDPRPIPRVEPPPPPVAAVPVQPVPVALPVPSSALPHPLALKKEPSVPAVEWSLLLTYGQSISKEIKRYQKYPPVAQRRGWEGTAEVLLQIAADGKVTSITLGKTSGRPVLDDEALNMVRKASPLPQAPQNLRGRELTVTVPIVFKLQES
jgi:protein TonB